MSGPRRRSVSYTPDVHVGLTGDVLVPTDGRAPSDPQVRLGAALARRDRVALRLVGIPDPRGTGSVSTLARVFPAAAARVRRRRLDHRLRAQAARAAGLKDGRPELAFGPTRATDAAGEPRPALLVLARGDHTALDHLFEHDALVTLTRALGCAVLATSAGVALPTRALAAIDGSEASIAAARATVQVIGAQGLLYLCHVIEGVTVAHGALAPSGEREAERAQLGSQLLLRARAQLSIPRSVTVRLLLLAGPPGRTLLHFAAEHELDLIAAGSRRLGPGARHSEGSVTARLLRLATHAMLVAAGDGHPIDRRTEEAPVPPAVDLPVMRARRAD